MAGFPFVIFHADRMLVPGAIRVTAGPQLLFFHGFLSMVMAPTAITLDSRAGLQLDVSAMRISFGRNLSSIIAIRQMLLICRKKERKREREREREREMGGGGRKKERKKSLTKRAAALYEC